MNPHPADDISTVSGRSLGVQIRLYAPTDRPSLRRLCWETADRGRPLENVFSDRETVADVLTRYYTDVDSASTWVAESSSGVVGYLTGCLNDARYRRVMIYQVLPQAIGQAMKRGALGRVQTWRLLRAIAVAWRRGGFARPALLSQHYPAHLHLNLQDGFRGRRIGQQLLEQFLARARQGGVVGTHAAVGSLNHRACRFFERMGFTALSHHPAMTLGAETQVLRETIIYGLRL